MSKDDFESMIAEMLTNLKKLSTDFEIRVEDYTQHATLRDQIKSGIEQRMMDGVWQTPKKTDD